MFKVGDIVRFSEAYNIENNYIDSDCVLEILAVYENLDCDWRSRYRVNHLDPEDRKRCCDWVEDYVDLELIKTEQ